MHTKQTDSVEPRALSAFIAMFVTEAYEVEISPGADVEVMTKLRLIEYANNVLAANLGDENLPEQFQKLAESGGIENIDDAVSLVEWSGDTVSKLEFRQ